MRATPYREIVPHPALRPFVECSWVSTSRPGATHRVLPDGCVDVLFETTGAGSRGLLIGAMTRPREHICATTAHFTAVRFRPGGAWPFVDAPLCEWTDGRLPLAELWPEAARLEDAIAAAADHGAQVAHLERALLVRLAAGARPKRAPTRCAVACVAAIRADPSAFRLGALSDELGAGRHALARRVRELTGLGPKQLARILRMQGAIADLRRGSAIAAAAAARGYSDQAHLTREARALTGWTPSALRRAAGAT